MPLFWALFIERAIEVPFVRPCWGSLKTCLAFVGSATVLAPLSLGWRWTLLHDLCQNFVWRHFALLVFK